MVGNSALDTPMPPAVLRAPWVSSAQALSIEIPSYEAGLLAFFFAFLLMGIMYYVLKAERSKRIPQLNSLALGETVRFENSLSTSDAPYLAMITLVILEIVLDALVVVSVLQGVGSVAVGTMLALAAFIGAAILGVYRSAYMSDAFTRKPRLETISANLSESKQDNETSE